MYFDIIFRCRLNCDSSICELQVRLMAHRVNQFVRPSSTEAETIFVAEQLARLIFDLV